MLNKRLEEGYFLENFNEGKRGKQPTKKNLVCVENGCRQIFGPNSTAIKL